MGRFTLIVMLAIVLTFTGRASAVTDDVTVTPAYLKACPKEFSIHAKKHNDGLIHFTITHHLSGPRYLIAALKVRERDSVVLDASFPACIREKDVKYYVAVSPKQLSNTDFELSVNGLISVNGMPQPHPTVGGTDYQIHLADFAPKASKSAND